MDTRKASVRHGVVPVERRSWTRIVLLAVPVLAWAGLVFWLSSQPASAYQKIGSEIQIPGRDYYVHVGLYGVLSGLTWLWTRSGLGLSKSTAAAVAVGVAVLYGVSDEWHQSFVPGRTPDARDVLADGFGALTAVVVLWVLTRYWSRRSQLSSGETNAGG